MAVKRSAGEIFGDHLRELRSARGLTQVDLAERCGSPQARISELERGVRTPSLATILRLALALECEPTDLLAVFKGKDLARLLPK
jgi:transcriptional regulator with XRE-family HTH domain